MKSKKSVIVFAFIIDVLSFVVGVVGLFINVRNNYSGNIVWVLYLINGIVCLFAVMSFVLLIVKLRRTKKIHDEYMHKSNNFHCEKYSLNTDVESIDRLEYCLLKLKHLKSSRIISVDEFEKLRKRFFSNNVEFVENDKSKD